MSEFIALGQSLVLLLWFRGVAQVWSSICIRLVQGYIVGSQTGATRFAGHKGLLGVLDLHWAEA